ncbi:MAG: SMC-Scp complex subunit ScpB [Verrucomicrobiota bacterium]
MRCRACIAFKQPISQAEIDRMFGDTDKRYLVHGLRQAGMVSEISGADGRLHFVTTAKYLEHFALSSLQELQQISASEFK